MKNLILTLLIWCGLSHSLFAAESPSIRLFSGGKLITLLENDQLKLQAKVVTLIQSSNFHSGPHDKARIFNAPGVQQDYRDVVSSGEYLVLVFAAPKKIDTAGGEITAAEVVVGMRGPGGRNTVFTIAESGTVISHAKYSGEIYLELKKVVAAAHQ